MNVFMGKDSWTKLEDLSKLKSFLQSFLKMNVIQILEIIEITPIKTSKALHAFTFQKYS